jgi:hypothetical protein
LLSSLKSASIPNALGHAASSSANLGQSSTVTIPSLPSSLPSSSTGSSSSSPLPPPPSVGSAISSSQSTASDASQQLSSSLCSAPTTQGSNCSVNIYTGGLVCCSTQMCSPTAVSGRYICQPNCPAIGEIKDNNGTCICKTSNSVVVQHANSRATCEIASSR